MIHQKSAYHIDQVNALWRVKFSSPKKDEFILIEMEK